MKIIKALALTLSSVLAGTILGCAANGGNTPGSSQSPAIENCVRRGIAYFKEIGSYPKLFSLPDKGRQADEVARERCNRTVTAFP